MEKKVTVVIPNFNGEILLEKNLPSVITAFQNPDNSIKEIVVVDDRSQDGSIALLKRRFPEVKIVAHKKRRGFSAAVNTGVRSAKGNIIALLNTDVSVTKNFLVATLPHFDNSKVFAVSLKEKGYSWASVKFVNGFIELGKGKPVDNVRDTFWVSGGSGVFRREIWIKLGGMDEKLYSPYYQEDVDLSYRAQKRGYSVLWEPKSEVIHEHESTVKKENPKKRQRIMERNQLLFVWKNITSQRMFRKHVRGITRYTIRHPGYIRVVINAMFKLPIVARARRKEKKESKISDEAIFARSEK